MISIKCSLLVGIGRNFGLTSKLAFELSFPRKRGYALGHPIIYSPRSDAPASERKYQTSFDCSFFLDKKRSKKIKAV